MQRSDANLVGQVIRDRYRIERVIGEGGAGIVYDAYDPVLERRVAIKVVDITAPGSERRERLLKEARILAQFKHPNIIQVYDAGEIEAGPYIVGELVEGSSLEERLPMDFDDALKVIGPICDALAHAHKHGVIHRDLKPRNILISPEGTPILTDFGIAQTSQMFTGDALSGTAAYMSPEQATGKPLDERSDLYSFGVVMYQLITGRLPFEAEDPIALIFQHQFAEVVPPNNLDPGVPGQLSSLIVRLLGKKPGDRPGSAAEVRVELNRLGSLATASGLLRMWREQGVDILQPSTLLIIQKSAAEVTFDEIDLEYLLKSAVHSELELEPWVRLAGSPEQGLRILERILAEEGDAGCRLRIVEALCLLDTPDILDALLDLALHDPSTPVRSRAAVAAAAAGSHRAIAEHLLQTWERRRDPAALLVLSAVVEQVGLPENFGPYPRLRVWYEALKKRWRRHRESILGRAVWAGLGLAVLEGINGAAAPFYTYIRSRSDYYDSLTSLSLPAWILSGAIGFMIIGFSLGFSACFLIGLSDMFRRNRPEVRRFWAGGLAGLSFGLLLVLLTTLATETSRPPVPPILYNTVYFLYGFLIGMSLTLSIPALNEPVGLRARLPGILVNTALCAGLTIPYVWILYQDRALEALPVRVMLAGLMPLGIALGLATMRSGGGLDVDQKGPRSGTGGPAMRE